MKLFSGIMCFMTMISCSTTDKPKNSSAAQPPVATQRPVTLKKHGDVRVDPFYWMRERENPEVTDYLHKENAYVEASQAHLSSLRDTLYTEMRSRTKEDDESVPLKIGDYFYYVRFEKGEEYPIYARKFQELTAPEEIILNVNELAEGHSYYSVAQIKVTEDHGMLAFAVDTQGRRIHTIHFKNLKTGKILQQSIPNVTSDMEWANDHKTLFYVTQDAQTLRWEKVFRYQLEAGRSELIFHEKDETFSVSVSKSLSRKFLFLFSKSTLSTEARYFSADQPTSIPKVFAPREPKHEYVIEDGGDRFYVQTNYRAKNFRLMETSYGDTTKARWREVVPHREKVFLENIEVFKDFIALEERERGLSRLRVISRKNKKAFTVSFPDKAYVVTFGAHAEFDSPWLRYDYQSLVRPPSVYDVNMQTREAVLKKQKDIPNYDASKYETDRIFALAKDKTKIPITLLYKKGFKPNGEQPLLVYGYGSYGFSMDPWFNTNVVSLIDRGFVYAIAHIRGGSELGRTWYESGKLLKKKNTFLDFIACTETLVRKKYGNPKRVYAMGGSAGGLLMGAITNMRPDLYHGIVAQVPFVDVVTTMLDDSIPLTTSEYDEWGNPNDKKFYQYMKSYSPYDNVEKKAYPHLLAFSGLHDSQVQYWEPTKWVAKLRLMNTAPTKIFLRTEMGAGHSGASGRFEKLKERAFDYAFLLGLQSN